MLPLGSTVLSRTYTGSEETVSGRFGHGGILARIPSSSIGRKGSGGKVAGGGINSRDPGAVPSSNSLLAGLKRMQSQSNGGVVDTDASYAAIFIHLPQKWARMLIT